MRIAPPRVMFHALGIVFVVLAVWFAYDGEYLIAAMCALLPAGIAVLMAWTRRWVL